MTRKSLNLTVKVEASSPVKAQDVRFRQRPLKTSKFDGVACANTTCLRQAVTSTPGVPVCNRHYQHWKQTGDWNRPDKTAQKSQKCVVAECQNPVRSKYAKFCETHYYRVRRGAKNWSGPIHPPCKQCGAELCGNQSKFCSAKCGRKYHYTDLHKRMARWNSTHKLRAKKAGCEYEDVDVLAVFEDANWVCHICGEKIDPEIRWPDRSCASLDHFIALRAGGGHLANNCRPSHARCNFKKAQERDNPMSAKVKRMAGETGQQARRERNGSKFKKPAGYVSPLSSKSKSYKKPKWQKRIKA